MTHVRALCRVVCVCGVCVCVCVCRSGVRNARGGSLFSVSFTVTLMAASRRPESKRARWIAGYLAARSYAFMPDASVAFTSTSLAMSMSTT